MNSEHYDLSAQVYSVTSVVKQLGGIKDESVLISVISVGQRSTALNSYFTFYSHSIIKTVGIFECLNFNCLY